MNGVSYHYNKGLLLEVNRERFSVDVLLNKHLRDGTATKELLKMLIKYMLLEGQLDPVEFYYMMTGKDANVRLLDENDFDPV